MVELFNLFSEKHFSISFTNEFFQCILKTQVFEVQNIQKVTKLKMSFENKILNELVINLYFVFFS